MAERHTQRKQQSFWLWIISAVLLAAVLQFVFMRADTRNPTAANPADSMNQTQPGEGTPATPPASGTP